ncbi:hypothetical protein [Herbidospora sp. NBRC 101105]|uniref:hypothetical protein n=1 Tax=Herbidospora sp. NBRC 101105 TaxID=3032195 RepID=UPI00249FB31C|nr:hypothetical protein [Herbidospora sp. NBRC 101105]GLX92793.1 hypothetical protein Hesp01_07430 [Herbidospora sp. NBRC 101105]
MSEDVVGRALDLWAGGDFAAFVAADGGDRLPPGFAREFADRLAEAVAARGDGDAARAVLQTARSLPLRTPGVAVRLYAQQNTIAARQGDMATLLFGALPLDVRGVLMRCALPTRFEAGVYDAVLRGDGPDLAEMVAGGWLTMVSGRYRLNPALRETAWARWWIDEAWTGLYSVPHALRRTAKTIGDRIGDDLERLRLLVLADPDRAIAFFWILFERADARFDLVACQDLLDVLAADDLIGISSHVADSRSAYQARLTARTTWATEYRQTGRYLRRPDLEAPLTGDARVIHLHAAGGMGKTMLLRWFIARHCLAQWPHVPCARVDLDDVDPVNAVRHPWLVLLEIAAQLSPQVRGEPFADLLRDHGRYRRVLSRTAVPDTALLSEAAAGAHGDDVTSRFFATRLPDHVIVFDTLEELVLRPAADPRPFVETLARLSGRLVLSGRYDLRDRLPGFADAFPGAVGLEVPPFSDDLATAYLTGRRGITRPDLVEAMVRRADGLPFALAMYGDLAEANPALSAREVDEAREPALLYCLERILERIPDDRLRWLLRYAVVPRQFDAEFVAEVLWPHLAAGLRDERLLDDPAADERPDRRTKIFLPGPPPPEVSALWDELVGYAGATSWVQATGDGRLVLHENLRGPVRDLLRAQPVFTVLHEAAQAHYLARGRPAEAAYHAFQARGKAALRTWRGLVEEAWRSGRADLAGELADDLLIYATDDEVRYAAHVEQARAAIEAARRDRGPGASGAHWNRAERALAAAGRLGEPSAMHQALTAAVLQARDRDEEAQAVLDAATPAAEEWDEDVAAEAELVRAGSRDAETVEQTYEKAKRRGDLPALMTAALRLGLSSEKRGAPTAAVAHYLRESGDLPELARFLLRRGRPESALSALDGGGRTGDVDTRLATAEALLALRRPTAALESLTGEVGVASALLRSRAMGDLMEYEGALTALADARRAATLPSERAALDREIARIRLHVGGDAGAAEQALGDHLDGVLDPDPLWVDLLLARGRREGAAATARRMALGSSDPVARVQAAVWRLRTGLPDQRALVLAVEEIPVLEVRLTALSELRACALPVDLSESVLDPWLAERTGWAPGDRVGLDLIAVEVARLAGRAAEATVLLDEAVSWLARHDDVVWLDWIRARDRLGPATVGEPEPGEISGGSDLRGTFLVELARRRMSLDPERAASRLDRAGRLMGERPMYWHGLLWQTRAELAAARGEPDEHFRRLAEDVWRQLGRRTGSAEPGPEGEIVLVLDDSAPGGTEAWVARNDLGSEVLPRLKARLEETRQPVDVRLTGARHPGEAPWELLGFDGLPMGLHPRVRCVYRTPGELVAPEGPPSAPPRRVEILQPDPGLAARGFGVPGSLRAGDAYRSRDVGVTGAKARQVAVLHVAGVMDVSLDAPALSFLDDDPPADPDTLLRRLFRQREAPPLVVLDVLAPANRAEFHRQLLLRNRFAQELVRARFPVTVLAIGPAPGLTRSVAVTDVASSVAEGSTIPQLWRRLQSHGTTSEDDAYAFTATALFSNVRPADMPRFGRR